MLDWLLDLVVKRSRVVFAVIAAVTLSLAALIPRIQSDPAPEHLLSSNSGYDHTAEEQYKKWFGPDDQMVVVLLQSDDVLSRQNLQHIHDISLHFKQKRWVERVDSITVLNLPRRVAGNSEEAPATDDEELTLDNLNLDTLEAGDGNWDSSSVSTEVFNAILDIVESDPQRFPNGIQELGPQLSEKIKTDAVVKGAAVTEAEAAELRRSIATAPLLQGRLISKDHTIAAVALKVKETDARKMLHLMRGLNDYVAEYSKDHDVKLYAGGLPYLRTQIVKNMRRDNAVLIPITIMICMTFLWLSMRWWPGVVLPIATVGISAIMVVGSMALFGQKMNILTNTIVPLLIVIGIADAIHIVGRYREEYVHTKNSSEAVYRTVKAMGIACFLVASTTAVGFAALVVSQTVMLREYGITTCIGVMMAYVVTVTFLPAALTRLTPPKPRESTSEGNTFLDHMIMRISAVLLRHTKLVLFCTAIFTATSLYVSSFVRVDHSLLDQFDRKDPVRATTLLVEDKLNGVRDLEVTISGNKPEALYDPKVITAIEKVQHWAVKQPGVISTLAFNNLIRETYVLATDDPKVREEGFLSSKQVRGLVRLMAQRKPNPVSTWITNDGQNARIQLRLKDTGAKATLRLVDQMKSVLETDLSPLSIRFAITGDAYVTSRAQQAVVLDLANSSSVATLAIFLLLIWQFRSFRFAMLNIPPNLVPLAGTMAYMVVRDIPLNLSTLITFAVSLGLGVDSGIHFLSRFREEVDRGLRTQAAIIRTARGTGRAIVVSTAALMCGFGVMLLSSFVPVRYFGELIAVTLGTSAIGTLVVLPCLLNLFGLTREQKARHQEEDEAIASVIATGGGGSQALN